MNQFDVKTSRWTPVERVADKKGQQCWLMKCECGIQREVFWKNYLLGRSRSCGCYRREVSKGKRSNCRTLPPGVAAKNNLILVYKKGATKRGLSYDLTVEQFTELTSSCCHYCNRPPNPSHFPVAKGVNGAYQYNGIDRKDNTSGYTTENCISACTECNRAKGVLTYDEFVAYLDALILFRKSL